MEQNKGRVAIVPGSFDPITLGHVNIAKRAAELYDKVYLAVMINADKSYMFTLDERERIARAATKDIENLEVISSEGYLFELAMKLSAVALVKGVRNDVDRAYELKMAEFNRAHYPEAETVLLECDDGLANISSTLVRGKIESGEDLSAYLPKSAIDEIKKILSQK